MAELTFGIAGIILEKLASPAYQEFRLAGGLGLQTDLKRLELTISTIKIVLLDAEDKQASNPKLSHWLAQLKDILYDADDVLDEIEYKALRKEASRAYGSTRTKVRHFFSSSKAPAFHFKLGRKIKHIRERLDQIAADKDQFNLSERRDDGHVISLWRDKTHSFVDPSTVLGRDNDKEHIINLLRSPNAIENLNVIPIVGLGGLGKTTLAKLVYNDERVVNHFQLKMWVCVSDDFNLTRLIKEILKSAGVGFREDSSTVDTLQFTLREHLKDKRFLLVLDDVWDENRDKWIELKDLLIGGSNGSKIIVSTRSELVASIMGTVPTYHLKNLFEAECLSLFVKCAFQEGEDKRHPNLLPIAKEIVKKCKGVPLAVKSLGGLLYSKVDESEWKLVRDNEIWELEEKEGGILPALRLSYNQMSIHLKRCFAYCSLFPKDHVFSNIYLIQFWMAHGLILQTPVNKNQELEDIGNLCIRELMSRCFFQDFKESVPFVMYSFKMHDLVHDLAQLVAKGECSVVDSDNKDITGTARHLSISYRGEKVPKDIEKLTTVRTIICQTEPHTSLVEACISRFKSLRVLDLSYSSFEVLPSSIDTLYHLRYLDLSSNKIIKKLPNSICKLYNLQTLFLGKCDVLERLPKDMRNMINLRYLAVTTTDTCLLENGVCCFNSLRILVIVECPRLETLVRRMDGCLTQLRTLFVTGCDSLTSLSHIIKPLTALETLVIRDCEQLCLTEGEDNQDLNLSLQNLQIEHLPKLEALPEWLRGSANTLNTIRIKKCKNLEALPEWLPTLKSLQTLEIIDCPKLSSLPEGMHGVTTLKKLKIEDCPKLSCKYRPEDWSNVPRFELN